jgi:hypothetical protein
MILGLFFSSPKQEQKPATSFGIPKVDLTMVWYAVSGAIIILALIANCCDKKRKAKNAQKVVAPTPFVSRIIETAIKQLKCNIK